MPFLVPPIGLTKRKSGVITPPSFVAFEIDRNGSGDSNVTVNVPSGTQDGDLMVFFWFGAGGSSAQVLSRPAGWTNQHAGIQNLDGNQAFEDCDTRIASSEPASYTWSLNGGASEGLACILTYRPVSATQLDGINGSLMSTGSTSHTAPNVTTSFDNSMILSAYLFNRTGIGIQSISTPPSGMTERVNIDGTPVSRDDLRLTVYDEVQATAGTFTGKTITYDSTGDGYGITLGIRAAAT